MRMKTCSKCKIGDRLEWHHSYCRECYNILDRKRYYGNRENRLKRKRASYEDNKEKNRLSRLRYPEKWKARQDLRNAVAKGLITKLPCEVCGEKKVHAHHTDYSKPFDVMWLCVPHHYQLHRKYNENGEKLGK